MEIYEEFNDVTDEQLNEQLELDLLYDESLEEPNNRWE